MAVGGPGLTCLPGSFFVTGTPPHKGTGLTTQVLPPVTRLRSSLCSHSNEVRMTKEEEGGRESEGTDTVAGQIGGEVMSGDMEKPGSHHPRI